MAFQAILTSLLVDVGLAAVSAALQKAPKGKAGEPRFPVADPTAPIPVVIGTTRIGMSVIYKARAKTGVNNTVNRLLGAIPVGSAQNLGFFYYADILGVLCHGGVHAIHEVYVDRFKKLSTAPAARIPLLDAFGVSYTPTPVITPALPVYTAPAQTSIAFTIKAPDLLGGKFSRGGVGAGGDANGGGTLRFFPGTGAIEHNARLEALAGTDLPCYPWLCTVAFENDFYLGNQPELPSFEFVVSSVGGAPITGTGYLWNATANAGNDANPGFALWSLLTDARFGMNYSPDEIDVGSLISVAKACDPGIGGSSEFPFGVSFAWTDQKTGEQTVDELLATLDGVRYLDPITGKLAFRLLRAPNAPYFGYGIANEVILSESNITSLEWSEAAADGLANEIVVEFIDRARDYTKNSVRARNVAAINALGRVETRTVSFLGVQDRDLAMRLAQRELRARTTPGRAKITMDRTGYMLTKGQPVTLYWAKRNIVAKIMRVADVRDAPADQVQVTLVSDAYSSEAPSFVVEDMPDPTPPVATPTLAPYGYLDTSVSGTATGTAKLFLYDPSNVVTLVEYRTTSGAAAPSAWTPKSYPYTATVTRSPYALSTIEFRVTYTDAAGASQQLTFVATFEVDADTLTSIIAAGTSAGAALGSISAKEVFVRVPEDDQWLSLSTIPTSEVEIGTEYRTKRYLVGMGSVRFNANIKTLTGTPTLKLKYSTDNFGSVADLLTWTPTGTGVQSSGFAAVPSGAKVDAGLTLYIADGANTAALDLYALDVEFVPTTVSAAREHSTEHAPEFS